MTEAGFRALAEVVETVDAEPYLAILEERFGIPPKTFAGHLVFRPNSKHLAIADRRLVVPEGAETLGIGMPFLYVRMATPRLTTAAAIAFGAAARRNVLDLDDAEVDDFVARREFPLRSEEASKCTGPGWVLARHRGMTVGLGRAKASEAGLVVVGMVPRSWAARR
jgi:NOL1/NOP2/fmu family ribosome biogenesis protein